MTVVATRPAARLTLDQAEALLAEIKTNFLALEENIRRLIDGHGWLALGYPSLLDLWTDRLSWLRKDHTPIAGMVVSALLDEGHDDMAIALAVKGVTEIGVSGARRRKAKGLPDDRILVRQHERKRERRPAHTVHIPLPGGTYERWVALCKRLGTTPEAEGEIALRLHMAELESRSEQH